MFPASPGERQALPRQGRRWRNHNGGAQQDTAVHARPMKTQGLLRDFHRIHGKNSILFVISKFDFGRL